VLVVVLLLMLLSSAAAGRHVPGLCPLVDLIMMWAASAREVLGALVPFGFLRRARRMDSRCPCDRLVMVQASLPRTSAREHEQG
jgi:hypothetical protein